MAHQTDFLHNIRKELSSGALWLDRAVVLAYAATAGLCVVGFTLLSNQAFALFTRIQGVSPWLTLVWMPIGTALIVWLTRRFSPGAAGSGIPQVMAGLDPHLPVAERGRFVSLRLSLAKIVLSAGGLLAGLSLGREGPSVQVAAGVMQHAQRWLRPSSGISRHALLVAGGAAGIAAAFNAPLAGVVFALEELSRTLESRSSSLIITAIVLAGLVAVSTFGNMTYFGMIRVPPLGLHAVGSGVLVALVSGLAGGLFARLLIASLTGSADRINRWRRQQPVAFAALCGLAVACIGGVAGGATYGAGSETVRQMLDGGTEMSALFAPLKFLATWLTAWSGVPGGIFAPSLSIGAGIGQDIALLTHNADLATALIAMGMAGFLAAVTQAPLTSFIIVMEMVDGHAMVLSLMACALLASLVSRLLCRSLYTALSESMLQGLTPAKPASAAARDPAAR